MLRMDPRVKTSAAALAQQFQTSRQLYEDAEALSEAATHANALREQLETLEKSQAASADVKAFGEKLDEVAGSERRGPPRGGVPETIDGVRGDKKTVLAYVESHWIDMRPRSLREWMQQQERENAQAAQRVAG